MAYDVIWTERAATDVDELIRYIAVDLASPRAAAAHLDALDEAVSQLGQFPEAHAISDQPALQRRSLRVCRVKSNLIIYGLMSDCVMIHRVVHERQDYAKLLL